MGTEPETPTSVAFPPSSPGTSHHKRNSSYVEPLRLVLFS
jgi:hypothetical protein